MPKLHAISYDEEINFFILLIQWIWFLYVIYGQQITQNLTHMLPPQLRLSTESV